MNPANTRALAALLVAILLLAGCGGGGGNSTTPPPQGTTRQTFTSAHFVFHYTPVDSANITSIAAQVEAEYSRIIADLHSSPMPPVNVTFYTDHQELVSATQAVAGTIPPGTIGLITAQDEVHIMSPNLPSWGSFDIMIGHIVHEFAHCVSLHTNSSIANNPRWFWETVAVFESHQFFDPHTLPYMTAHNPPTFQQMNDFNNSEIYRIGYLIGEYVVAQYGASALPHLIAGNGNVQAVLGVSQAQFEQDWFAWVRQHYGI